MIPKFRAWHKEKKIMADVVQINFWQKELSVKLQDVAHFYVWEFSEIELMQWTGLKDIYADDILEHEDGSRYIVYWALGHCGFALDKISVEGGAKFTLDSIGSKYRLIGNIHQNGDLLNV